MVVWTKNMVVWKKNMMVWTKGTLNKVECTMSMEIKIVYYIWEYVWRSCLVGECLDEVGGEGGGGGEEGQVHGVGVQHVEHHQHHGQAKATSHGCTSTVLLLFIGETLSLKGLSHEK